MPVTVIGVGSNLLVRDGGIPGVVIRLGRGFAEIAIDGTTRARRRRARSTSTSRWRRAMPASPASNSCRGIPGTIGGALRMNAGAYGGEMKDVADRGRGARPRRAGCTA